VFTFYTVPKRGKEASVFAEDRKRFDCRDITSLRVLYCRLQPVCRRHELALSQNRFSLLNVVTDVHLSAFISKAAKALVLCAVNNSMNAFDRDEIATKKSKSRLIKTDEPNVYHLRSGVVRAC